MHDCNPMRNVIHSIAIFIATLAVTAPPAHAQSLDDRLDEERYLKGLTDLQLPEVLEHYIDAFPSEDPVRAMQFRLAAERMAMQQPGISPAEKLRVIEDILAARAQMIDRFDEDPRRIGWMLDQASDLQFALLPIEGAGLTTLYGSPSPSQQARASRVARGVDELARQAEVEVSQAILDLEATPGYADNVVLQGMRRDLAERDRDRRAPFFRGIGAYLRGAVTEHDDATRQQLWRLTRDVLEPLADQLTGAIASQARLYAGLAMARLGQFEPAEERFRAVAMEENATPGDVFMARMGGVLNRLEDSGPDAALRGLASIEDRYTEPDDMFFRVLIADQRFLIGRQRAMQQAEGPARDAALAEAFDAYIDLLKLDLGVKPDAMQTIVLGKLSNVTDAEVPLDRLPALVTIARADAMAREAGEAGEAVALYERVIERAGLTDSEKALALFGLGRTHARNEQPLRAADSFARIARDLPRDRRAEESIVLAVSLAAGAYQQDQQSRTARQTLDDALQLLLDRYANLPDIDKWRYLAGRVAMQEGRLEEAVARFESCSAGSEQVLDARFMVVRCIRAMAERAAETSAAPAHERTLAAIRNARTQLQAGLRDASSSSREEAIEYYLDYLSVFEAESQMAMGAASRAVDVLDAMRPMEQLDPAVLADALRLRINALQSLGQARDAMDEVQQLLRTSPEQVDDVIVPMLSGIEREVRRLIDEGRDAEARTKATGDLMTLANILEDWISERGESMGERIGLYHAIARANELAQRYPDALSIYQRLLSYEPGGAALLRGKAECLYHIGGNDGLGEAIRIFKRLTAAGEQAVGSDIYWLSQLRSVQILDKVGRNTNQIVPHIQRLEREDSNLGGPRYRQQFNQLLAKHQ